MLTMVNSRTSVRAEENKELKREQNLVISVSIFISQHCFSQVFNITQLFFVLSSYRFPSNRLFLNNIAYIIISFCGCDRCVQLALM